MTHILIRRTAKDLAGAFHDSERSPMFRRAFPTPRDFIGGFAHRRDGRIEKQEPGWWHFVDMAKETLAKLLHDKSVSQHEKDRIYDALLENGMRGTDVAAQRVLQTSLERREDAPPEKAMVKL